MPDGSSKITDSMYLQNKPKDEKKTGNDVLGKDDFMKLLIAQLQNQDPTDPMKDTEFIAQMAQFSSPEQTMNLANAFEHFAEAQQESQLIQYNSFVGKNVHWTEVTDDKDEDGKPVIDKGEGMIASVKFVEGSVVFTMEDGKELSPGNISEVFSAPSESNSLVEASMLIGKKVSYMADDEEQESVVTSVSNKEGKTEYILEDGSRIQSNDLLSISSG